MRPCRERILRPSLSWWATIPGRWQTRIKQRLVVCRDGITPPIDGADGQGRRLSPQDLMSRRADGRLTAFLKLDVEQEAVATPPTVE